MKAAVVVFPGINRERDMARALTLVSGRAPQLGVGPLVVGRRAPPREAVHGLRHRQPPSVPRPLVQSLPYGTVETDTVSATIHV